jgi:DnaJ-class molecular chaperone
MICPECDGTGRVERCNWNGYYEVPCTNCYGSLGEVNGEELDDSNDSRDLRDMRT